MFSQYFLFRKINFFIEKGNKMCYYNVEVDYVNNDTINERLKVAFKNSTLTQADIVKKTGITKGALSSYLSGRYTPKQNNIFELAKVLDVNPGWLMGYDIPMKFGNYGNYIIGSEIENMINKISKKICKPKEELFDIFFNYISPRKEDINYQNLLSFFEGYYKMEHGNYKKILKDKGLMDENDNIDEDSFNKLMKIADMMKEMNNKE